MKTTIAIISILFTLAASAADFPAKVSRGQSFTASDQLVIQHQETIAVTGFGGNTTLKNFGVSQGGLILEHGSPFARNRITLTNVFSLGQPNDNNKEPGCFLAITADSGCENITIDNTGLRSYLIAHHFDPKYEWIQQGKAEAAIRLMDAQFVTLRGLKIRCSMHWNADTKRMEPWKQCLQLRSQRGPGGKWLIENCEFDGPVEIGRQALPGGMFQTIDEMTFKNCTFHYWPISRKPGVKKLTIVGAIHREAA